MKRTIGHIRFCEQCGREVLCPGRESESKLKTVVCPKCKGVKQPEKFEGCN